MVLSELVIESIKASDGLTILFFTENNFRFEGKILGCDGKFLKYYDIKKNCVRIVSLEEIKECELR